MPKKKNNDKQSNKVKKPIHKKIWFWALLIFLILVVFTPKTQEAEEANVEDKSTQSIKAESETESKEKSESEAKAESESKEKAESEAKAESKEKAESESEAKEKVEAESKAEAEESLYRDLNDELAIGLEQNKGWAMGTIDRDGNPTSSGEPNPEYSPWMYVHSIVYNGKEVAVQVTADFLSFSESDKEFIAGAAQGSTMSYGLLDSRPFVTIYNGEDVYGHSKVLSSNEYKWNE